MQLNKIHINKYLVIFSIVYISASVIFFIKDLLLFELLFSILTRLFASTLAVWIFVRYDEKRILVLALLFFLMAMRQILTLFLWLGVVEKSNITQYFSELPGYAVTLLSLISIIYIGRILKKNRNIIHNQKKKLDELHGLLPICSKCKKIRDEEGYWNKLEHYFNEHSDLKFSHGLCNECYKELYGHEKWFKDLPNTKNLG